MTLTPETIAELRALNLEDPISARDATRYAAIALNALPALLDTAERVAELEAEVERLKTENYVLSTDLGLARSENATLRELVKDGQSAVTAAFLQSDKAPNKYDAIVAAWQRRAAAALKGDKA